MILAPERLALGLPIAFGSCGRFRLRFRLLRHRFSTLLADFEGEALGKPYLEAVSHIFTPIFDGKYHIFHPK